MFRERLELRSEEERCFRGQGISMPPRCAANPHHNRMNATLRVRNKLAKTFFFDFLDFLLDLLPLFFGKITTAQTFMQAHQNHFVAIITAPVGLMSGHWFSQA
jgi:hypothetical protein